MDSDPGRSLGHGLAGSQGEGDAGPSGVVDLERHGRVRLSVPGRIHARLLQIGGHGAVTDRPGTVPAPWRSWSRSASAAVCTPRQAIAQMRDLAMVKKLFEVIGPRYKERNGGYTRVMKAGFRYGNSAPVAVIEFVDRDVEARARIPGRCRTMPKPTPPRHSATTPRRLQSRPARFYVAALISRSCHAAPAHARRQLYCPVFALCAVAGMADAQDRRVPSSPAELQLSFAPVVKRVTPAVVNVYAARVIENRNPFMNDPLFRRFFGTMPREQVMRSLGSGVIVDPSGLVVTNYHVIEGASEVKVALSDKREFDAEIVLKDEHSDLTILRLKDANEKFPVLDFANSDDLQVGDVVLAIGDPFGVGQTVTHGIVSALARTQVGISDYQFFIQTDAAINPGNSGGALVDLTAGWSASTPPSTRAPAARRASASPFRPTWCASWSAPQGGSAAVKRPWLGAKLQEVTAEIADSLGLKRPAGALVASVAAGGPAARAGIKTGDVIAAVDGTVVDDPNSFDYRFATKPLGGSAQVTLLRQGREMTVAVGLQTAPESPRDEVEIQARSPFTGAKVANLSPALADELRLDTAAHGVVITGVADGSTAQTIGFRKGDIVLSVNNQKIEKSADLDRVTRAGGRSWRVTINRGGQEISVMFSG